MHLHFFKLRVDLVHIFVVCHKLPDDAAIGQDENLRVLHTS